MVLLVPLLLARKISSLERPEAGEPQTAAAAPSGASAPVPCLPAADDDPPEFTELLKKNKMAQESTNEFTWKVLAVVSRPATKQRPITTANGNVVMSNDEEWETWADDSALFPRPADEQHPPCWDEKSRQRNGVNLTSSRSKTKLIPAVVAVTESALAQQQAHAVATTAPAAPVPPASCESPGITCNEVRHNRHDFESIVKNRLWYVQGLKQVAALKVNGYIPQGQIIDHESIEIKAEWQRIQCTTDCETKKLLYHWNYDKSGNLYGLVAFHLITRALDNWTWATFEWEGNPGRCDYYGCHDVWGGEDIDAPSQPTYQPYPAAKLSDKVTSLNWKGSAKSEWSHYRLKGTQTAFFGKDGKPTILGSSILEQNVIGGRASCITCHAEASVTSDGMSANSLGKQVPTTAQARTARAGQQYAAIGTPELSSDSHPIGFIWSIIGATCDFSDTVHPCPSLKP